MKNMALRFNDGPEVLREARDTSDGTINLTRLLAVLRRRRRIIIWSLAVWCVLGVFYVTTTPSYYDATASVLLDSNIGRTIQQVSTTTSSSDPTTSDTEMDSAQLVITSDAVAQRVAKRLKLEQNPAFTNPPVSMTATLIAKVIGAIRAPMVWLRDKVSPTPPSGSDPDQTTANTTPPSAEDVAQLQQKEIAQYLQQRVKVYRIGRSSAFAISYRADDPALAADIVNAFSQVYVSDVLNANFTATEQMTEWMQGRLATLQTNARNAAQDAEKFRAKNGLVDADSIPISQGAVSTLNQDLSSAIADAARAHARVSALKAVVQQGLASLVKSGIPSGLPAIDDPDFIQRQRALTNSVAALNRLHTIGGASAQQIQSSEQRVEDAANQLFMSIKLQFEQARGAATLADARVSALQNSLNSAVGHDAKSGPAQVKLNALEQRAQTLSTLYQTFLSKFQELDQQKTFPISNVRILNLADPPQFASGPSTKLTLALCIVLGLFTGLVLAAIREWRDRFVYTADQINNDLGFPFLGYLQMIKPVAQTGPSYSDQPHRQRPAATTQDHDRASSLPVVGANVSLYTLQNMRSQFTETLRNIRLSSQLTGPAGKSRVIGLSSARPGEGKTFTSLNLAALIAEGGASVILIDADPHRCGLSHLLGVTDQEGLLEVLSGARDWTQTRCQVANSKVDFMPSLVPADFSHASEILAGAAFKDLLTQLRQSYDFVILDLAPMGAVSDVRAVIGDIDQLVMLAEWGKTSKLLLHKLLTIDPKVHQKLLGIVLNKVDLKRLKVYSSEEDSASYLGDYSGYYSSE